LSLDVTSFFAVLSDPTRMRLLQVLASQTGDQALCVGALAARLGVSQPAVSQHLRVLRSLGLVRAERRGLRVHYLLDREQWREWHHAVEQFLSGVTVEREPSNAVSCSVADAARGTQAEQSGAASGQEHTSGQERRGHHVRS